MIDSKYDDGSSRELLAIRTRKMTATSGVKYLILILMIILLCSTLNVVGCYLMAEVKEVS